MKRVTKGLLTACGALLLTVGAMAQDYGRPVASSFQPGGYWDRERLGREYRRAFYDRLQDDLSRAESARYLRGDDLRKFDRAHREIGEFQAKWARGLFDPREMDSAIFSVQRVIEIPVLRRDDRDALRADLGRMREFRSHMEGRR
ncbi:MAG TPA: hypothetical protein VGL72_33150 [Bryobacteraceae bacterium]|jgi:hypothetical protein